MRAEEPLAEPSPPDAIRCLKRGDLRSVWLVHQPGGRRVTLKTWQLDVPVALKLMLGIAQPQRQCRGTRRLERAGIPTPKILRGWRLRRLAGRPVVWLEMGYVEGRSALELLQDGQSDEITRRRTATAIGRLVSDLGRAGLLHRDLKADNIVVAATDHPQLALIDTVGVRRSRDQPGATARMLERLAVVPGAMGLDIPACVWQPLMRNAVRHLSGAQRRRVFTTLRRMRRTWQFEGPPRI